MRKFSSQELSSIIGVEISSCFVFSNISTDTRTIQAGDLFVAISGDNFDGNKFAKIAEEKGAVACVLTKPNEDIILPQIIVGSSRLILAKIAKFIRNEFSGKVIGLTGSVGKTTSKQMLSSVLSMVGNTHYTKGNLNNDLGVPFTLFDLPVDSDYAVIEMGANHLEEISYLTNIVSPDVAMITNAAKVHIEGFGSIDNVAKGKGEIFNSLLKNKDTVAVINNDDKYSKYWLSRLAEEQKVITFSVKNNNANIFASNISDDFSYFDLNYKNKINRISLPIAGEYNVRNALGVSACAVALGVSLDDISKGISQFETEKGRMQQIVIGKILLIDDSYNANPFSTKASVSVLSTKANKRILVLSDMAELGSDENEIHYNLGVELSNLADVFYCFGKLAKCFAKGVGDKAKHFSNIDELNSSLLNEIQMDCDVSILVKGSRSMQMERVVTYLKDKLNKEVK